MGLKQKHIGFVFNVVVALSIGSTAFAQSSAVAVNDPSFEANPTTAWALGSGAIVVNQRPRTGLRSLRLERSASGQASQNLNLAVGSTYRAAGYARLSNSRDRGQLVIRFINSAGVASERPVEFTGSTSYINRNVDFTVPSDTVRSEIVLRRVAGLKPMNFDDISVQLLSAPPAADTQAPTAPGNLVANAVSSTQVNLSYSASNDNVGIVNYRVERCVGSACTNFAQVGISSTNSYEDRQVVASTSYRYRVRASDAAGNLSAYSAIASATTPATPPPPTTGACTNCPVPNVALIPAGDPGESATLVNYSGEMPSSSDIGAFRTVCNYSHMNFDDAIVFPGQPGRAHLHTYFGNTLADAHSTNDSLRSSGNSTCRGGALNRSAYWMPSIIDTRDGRPLAPIYGNFYYKSGYVVPNASSQIRPFQPGHRMIAGSASSVGPQEFITYDCDSATRGHYNHGHSIPVCAVGDLMTMSVDYPQCGNGQIDSPDHKSHMAYPRDGACPSTHPILHPEITMNVSFKVVGQDSSTWRLSSDNYIGGAGGFSGHADWMNGWALDFRGTPERPLPAQSVMDFWVRNVLNLTLDGHSHLLGNGYMMDYPWKPEFN